MTTNKPREFWIPMDSNGQAGGTVWVGDPKEYPSVPWDFIHVIEYSAVDKLIEAMKWIMPKVHQAYHDGEIDKCDKSTCQEYIKALSDFRGENETT